MEKNLRLNQLVICFNNWLDPKVLLAALGPISSNYRMTNYDKVFLS